MKSNNEIRRPVKPHGNIKKIRNIILAILLILLLIVSFTVMYVMFYKPDIGLGNLNIIPGLDNKTNDNEDGSPPVTSSGNDPLSLRKKDFYTFLVLGRDTVGLNTDIIMLASFDVTNESISVMQIPRDTYVEVEGSPHKINAVYSIMHSRAYNNKEKDIEDAAMREMMEQFEYDLNICIDNYALINLAGFRNIIDLIGGIPMTVPFNMDYDDPEQGLYIHLRKGYQVLDGKKAEQFVRYRSGYVQADIGRIDAQKLFMTAIIEQLKNNISVSTVTGMISELSKNVKTSLSVSDLIYFAKEFYLTKNTDINFITFPGTDIRADVTSGTWYYVMHKADTLTIMNNYFNVYKEEITVDMFDSKLAFTNERKNHISNIYNTLPSENLNEYVNSADNIVNDGIYIPKTS